MACAGLPEPLAGLQLLRVGIVSSISFETPLRKCFSALLGIRDLVQLNKHFYVSFMCQISFIEKNYP